MKNMLSNLWALMLVAISFIFNSYLLALCLGFIYSLIHLLLGHSTPKHYSNEFFVVVGFCIILFLLAVGIFNIIPPLSRILTKSRKPLQSENEKITKILLNVMEQIKLHIVLEPKILISDSIIADASCYGAKTIIVGTELLNNYSDSEIAAVLLHEISHLYNKEGLIIIAIFWINVPMQIIMWLYRKYAKISLRLSDGLNQKNSLFSLLSLIPLIVFSPIILLNFVGKILLKIVFMLISRIFEYNADRFTAKHGYRDELISFLNKQKILEQNNTIMAILFATHPSAIKRIAKLERY